jgi:hypothetical protein
MVNNINLTLYLFGYTIQIAKKRRIFTILKRKIISEQKRSLKILVEQFLERSEDSVANDSRPSFEKIYCIMMKNTIPADNIDIDDLTDKQLKDAVIGWHQLLLPLWKKFRKFIFDFKENVLPEREKAEAADKALNDPSSPLYNYKDLQGYVYVSRDKFYELNLMNAATDISISFDAGKVSIFRSNLNAVNSFIDIIKDAPIDLFAKCGHCKKVIIVSRKGKKYHSGCAAKALQKAFWRKNKTVAREKEKIRYAERRKKRDKRRIDNDNNNG